MASKRSYKSDVIRFTFLFIALAVFFVGPRFVTSDQIDDIDDTITFVKASKINARMAAPIVHQLEHDRKFAQENANTIKVWNDNKVSSVTLLAFAIMGFGLGAPFILKWLENRKTAGSA